MSVRVVILIVAVLLFPLLHAGNTGTPGEDVLTLYRKAERLFTLENPTDQTDSVALLLYRKVIHKMEKQPVDSLLFQSWLKVGILLDVKSLVEEAKEAYLTSIRIRRQQYNSPVDSLLFRPYVYAGTAYYHLNNFDSADYYLLEAEKISNHFPQLEEQDRLYNALGALYYENGNYVQSRNYFSRALTIIKSIRPSDFESAIHFESNIAASYYKLGLYRESLELYYQLLKKKLYTSQIYVNMGKAYAATGDYARAMQCFRKVKPKEVPGVYNEMANVQLLMDRPDSAAFFLDQYHRLVAADPKLAHELDEGINYLYRGEVLNARHQLLPALQALQKAIVLFSGQFNNEDIFSNPSIFAGSFASYTLFDALHAKAATLERMFREGGDEKYLRAAYDTYQQTIALLRYIEKNYDTDDARIFLKRNSQDAYREAFDLCLKMARQYPDAGYLEQAFLVAEKNRASIIAARLTENRLKKIRGIDSVLLQQERNIKYNIARLIIRSELEKDAQVQKQIAKDKQFYEMELSRLQKQIEENSSYYQLKYADSFPSVSQIRQELAPDQVVISFYDSDSAFFVFTIARDFFRFDTIASKQVLRQQVEDWITALSRVESGKKFEQGETGRQLYARLVKPLLTLSGGLPEWTILPDGILHYLPFESLPADESGSYLLEKAVISYHFSSRFLLPNTTASNIRNNYHILSFAPFAQRGFSPMGQLPASAAEVAALPGRQFTDSVATKKHFIEHINHYPIVHLATHAVADLNNPSGSYIAFYPGSGSPAEDNLYLDELYGLNLDATELVIISACETGTGKLVGSEGLFSFSRGFTYAGSASVINSLWKADDAATSAILKQFHHYLRQGYSKAKALQQAKLDYIRDHSLRKTPDYWGHLILVGNARPVVEGAAMRSSWLIAGTGVVLLVVAGVFYQRYTKKKRKST